jgi:hypothetical protein
MGLENTGLALASADTLWIDPIDYQEPLACIVAATRKERALG